MNPTSGIQEMPLTVAALREIAGQEGPAVTLLIPDHQPGAQQPPRLATCAFWRERRRSS